MVDDLHAAQAELRVLVADRVEAVRAGGDDRRDPVLGVGRRERRDVLLGQHLEEVLVAGPPGGVAAAGLQRAEDGERHLGLAQQLGHGAHDLAVPVVEGSGAADPEQDAPVERSAIGRPRGSCATSRGRWSRRRHHRSGPGPGTSRPFAQSSRADRGWPHGLPAFSMLRNAAFSSFGNRLSSRTALRRISTIVSTCSMSTGQPSTHQPQVVHCHTASSGDGVVDERQAERLLGALVRASPSASSTAAAPPLAPPFHARWADAAAASAVSATKIWSRSPSIRCFGLSVLPVTDAGQNSMHRPHSVQASGSSRWRQVRSLSALAPKTGSASPSSGSASRSIMRSAPRGSRLLV